MKRLTKIPLVLSFALLLMVSCTDKDQYYERPGWLEPPIYEVLKQKGNFTSYLKCLDRTLYAAQLNEGGYFTIMAPNDEAFAAYMQAKGYAKTDDIPLEEVNKIIAYSILQSYWLSENLGDLFTGSVGNRYSIGDAFKKQTYFYNTIYKDSTFNNNWVIDQNVNYPSYSTFTYNYKYYQVFMQSYFAKSNLTAADYNEFFPNSTFVGGQTTPTGLIGNVFNGQIVTPNLKARNGIVHEVSVVNLPLDNMEKLLQKDQYAVFNSLLDFKDLSGTYVYKNYKEDVTLTEKFKLLKPNENIQNVYVKSYNTVSNQALAFSPALDAIYEGSTVNTLSDGYTLFVPENDVLTAYINTRLLKYYHSLSELPIEAITTLINTHMSNSMIWPSQLKSAQVSTGEYANGEGAKGKTYAEFGVVDKKFTSNGFIYTLNHVIKSKLFETVYAAIFLNPDYSLLNAAYNKYFQTTLREEMMKSVITGYPGIKHTVLMLSNDQLKGDGFTYNSETSTFSNSLLVSTNVTDRIRRTMQLHMFPGWKDDNVNSEVTFQDGVSVYGGWGFRNTVNGDVVRYKNNQLQASGNIEENTFVTVTKKETFDNGSVYSVDKMLQYSKRTTSAATREGWNYNTLWYYLKQTATENPNVSQFVDYIQYALKATDTDVLNGLSEDNFYTIVMPNNNALIKARTNKDLPDLDSLKNGLLSENRKVMIINFVKSHFLEGYAMPDDRLLYLFPYNVNSPNKNIVSTSYRVNNEKLRFINQRTYVIASKDASGNLVFTPDNIVQNEKVVISGGYGMTTPAPRIVTGAASKGYNGYRSNRIAGRAIHHEYTNYFKFAIKTN